MALAELLRGNTVYLDANIATAHVAGCQALLTNDIVLRGAPGLRVFILSEVVAP